MRSVSIDVEIGEFRTRALIDELHDRRIITVSERNALRDRKELPEDGDMKVLAAHDAAMAQIADQARLIEEAEWNARRRDLRESVHCIVRAFPGLSVLENLIA